VIALQCNIHMILFFLSPEGFDEFCDQLLRIIDIAAAG
jgi:hypothetical protein